MPNAELWVSPGERHVPVMRPGVEVLDWIVGGVASESYSVPDEQDSLEWQIQAPGDVDGIELCARVRVRTHGGGIDV